MVNFPNQEKFIVYQVLPRLFGNTNENCVPNASIEVNGCGKFSDFDKITLKSIKELGCTHIWYTGIIEHSTRTDYSSKGILQDHYSIVKGEAGSPYAIKDYFDVDPDLSTDIFNRISEFKELVSRTHEAGLKVIIDFVPNHLARQYHSDIKPDYVDDFGLNDNMACSFSPMNNFYYILNESFKSPLSTPKYIDNYSEFPAKVTGNDCFLSSPSINDWYETVKLNYGVDYMNDKACYFNPVPDTWIKMNTILQYWTKMGVDGFRCDMAEMVPVEFWKWAISNVREISQDIVFIAEIYNPDQYSDYLNIAGFDHLYDKVGLYDNLKHIVKGDKPASILTNCWQSLGDKQNRMLNFLENHDEQRIASDFFIGNPYHALPALAISLLFDKTPFMLYFGQELGEKGMDSEGYSTVDGRTTIFDYWSISSIRKWKLTNEEPAIRVLYKKMLNMAMEEKAFRIGLTYDLGYSNIDNENFDRFFNFAFLRYFNRELLLITVNFQNIFKNLSINIPRHAFEYFSVSDRFENWGRDLLTGEIVTEKLSLNIPYRISIQPNSIRVVKFLLQ